MLFIGGYEHSVDQKGRARIPADFKDQAAGEEFVLTYGTGGCLVLHNKKNLDGIFEILSSNKVTDGVNIKAIRSWAFSMKNIVEDGQGRFIIPSQHREFANIDKQIVFVGMGNRIEIWAKEKWQEYNGEVETDFDEGFNSLSEYGI